MSSSGAIFHNVSVGGTITIANTFYFDGTLSENTVGTMNGSSSTIVYPRNGAAITGSGSLSFGQINIESGMSVTASSNFSASSTFTIDGTFTPTASTVISGTGPLVGTGTVIVTRTGSNVLGNQYALTTVTTTANTVEFAGTSSQTVNLPRTFKNVTFDNPAGVTLSLDSRRELLALAREYGFTIFEDDPYVDIRFRGEPLPSMLSLDDSDVVVHASSFTKTVCPGVRVGYLVGPETTISAIAKKLNELQNA